MATATDTLANLGSLSAEDTLALARERMLLAEEAESEWRAHAAEDLRFRHGEQWTEQAIAFRERTGRPYLTINRLHGTIRQIKNKQRAQKVGLRANPVDDDADVETAQVIQGMFRHIEEASRATVAYETAFASAVDIGKGYFRIVTEVSEVTPGVYEKVIRIRRIRNPLAVYFDPYTDEIDFNDANYAFYVQTISRREFETLFPDAAADATLDLWASRRTPWVTRDTVQVADYYYVERTPVPLVELKNGTIIPASEHTGPSSEVLHRFKTLVPTVYHTLINGFQVLESQEFPARWIPIVPIIGEETDIEGKIDYAGVVRFAMDAQRSYNFWKTTSAELMQMAPKTPVVAVEGQFEGYEHQWNMVNQQPLPWLYYRQITLDGQTAPKPSRLDAVDPVQIQAAMIEMQQAVDDIKTTTGTFDASLGATSNETSGKAILARQSEGDTANLHFTDAKLNALSHAGRIIMDMIPAVYSHPRTVRILGEDEVEEMVRVNEPFVDDNGKELLYDLTTGKYDVRAAAGQSFGTKRQEALELTTGLVEKYPPLFPIIGDQILRNIDGPGAEEMATRFRKTIDPRLLEAADEASTEEQLQLKVEELTQQLEQMQAAGQQLMAQMQQQQAEVEQMKLRVANKEQELALRERELMLETRLKQEELDLKRQTEERKLDLQEDKIALDAIQQGEKQRT